MKKLLALFLALTMVLSLAACSQGQTETTQETPTESGDAQVTEQPAGEDAGEPAPEQTPTQAQENTQDTAAAPAEEKAAEYHNQDSYEGPCLFRPEQDGVYRFYATNPSYEMQMYDPAAIHWSVYVLDEAFDDAWRFLPQAHRAAIYQLEGSITLELKAGQYVYCLCSWTSFNGDPAEDNAATLEIYRTQGVFGPTAENGYVQLVSINAETNYDLDGDGKADNIYYAIQQASEEPDGSWIDSIPMNLQINDREFLDPEADNPFQAYDLWVENCDVGTFCIVDLDPTDSLKEIAIRDWGNNDWRMTHLFRYEEGELVYLDTITSFPEDDDTTYHGDGTVSAYTRFDVMQTWGGVVTYRLEDGKMNRVPGEMVAPLAYEDRPIVLKQPLTVYREPNRDSELITLQPSDQPVSTPLTDTEHWVQIVCPDGTSGWAYFEDFGKVYNNGAMVDDMEIFDGLLFAG